MINNERGEISLSTTLILWVSFLLLTLLTLRLEIHHRHLKQKIKLTLCTKETLGLNEKYMTDMSKLNWGIENATKAQVITMFIPGLQGVSVKISKLKRALQELQRVRTVSFLTFLSKQKLKGCPTPHSLYKTPFEYNNFQFIRNKKGVAIMRERSWDLYFSVGNYYLKTRYALPELKTLTPRFRKQIIASKGISL